jgi:spermidine synthase
MLPATFCAGITLPLITYALIQQKHGEKSIGAVYASNTVGAIVGVIFAVHVGMTVFGLKGLISLGASVDIALGLFLLWRLRESEGTRTLTISTAIGITGVVATLLWVDLDAYKMASGVYRSGHLLSPKSVEILYHEDGKTATIDLVAEEHAVQVRTNGKTEAKISISENFPAASDEPTVILAGAIPLAIHPGAKKAANIGIGSGLTTHTLLAAPWLETVDTIEIEPVMVEAARRFGPRVEATFIDPRSHIYIEDAKTYFSTQNKKYDIIVSEPSNPWVSGTASLFSEEFYRLITRHLNKDGILVQWLQLYEIDLKLVASVFKSLSLHFSDYAVYGSTNSDILIVAKHNGKITRPDIRVFQNLGLKGALERIGVRGISDIELRNIGGKDVLDPLFASFSIPRNSDYFPILDLNAAKSRFLGAHALDLVGLGHVGVPAGEMLGTTVDKFRATDVTASPLFYRAQTARNAVAVRDFFMTGHFDHAGNDVPVDTKRNAELVRSFLRDCQYARRWDIWLDSLINVAAEMISYLTPEELEQVWTKLGLSECDNKLNVTQKHWISLLKAVSRRDADGMAETAAVLLSEAEPYRRANFDYALAAGMLGNIARKTPKETQRLWITYGSRLDGPREPWLLFRLLLAHSQEPPAYVR